MASENPDIAPRGAITASGAHRGADNASPNGWHTCQCTRHSLKSNPPPLPPFQPPIVHRKGPTDLRLAQRCPQEPRPEAHVVASAGAAAPDRKTRSANYIIAIAGNQNGNPAAVPAAVLRFFFPAFFAYASCAGIYVQHERLIIADNAQLQCPLIAAQVQTIYEQIQPYRAQPYSGRCPA